MRTPATTTTTTTTTTVRRNQRNATQHSTAQHAPVLAGSARPHAVESEQEQLLAGLGDCKHGANEAQVHGQAVQQYWVRRQHAHPQRHVVRRGDQRDLAVDAVEPGEDAVHKRVFVQWMRHAKRVHTLPCKRLQHWGVSTQPTITTTATATHRRTQHHLCTVESDMPWGVGAKDAMLTGTCCDGDADEAVDVGEVPLRV